MKCDTCKNKGFCFFNEDCSNYAENKSLNTKWIDEFRNILVKRYTISKTNSLLICDELINILEKNKIGYEK